MALSVTYLDCTYSEAKHKLAIATSIDELVDDPDTDLSQIVAFEANQGEFAFYPVEGMRIRSYAIGDVESYAVGKDGEAWTYSTGGIKQEQLPDAGLRTTRHLGSPSQVRIISGTPYVCGFAGQVYTRRNDTWVHMDDGLVEPEGTVSSIDLEGIHGTRPDDIYVVGSGGLLAHWDGRIWTRIPLMTDYWLAGVRCLAKDNIIAVGNNGVVVRGDGQRWRVEQIPGYERTHLADVELYNGRIYVAAVGQLLVLDGNRWNVVSHRLDEKKTEFFKLTVGDGRLWAMGSKRISSFDGRRWEAHIDPDNG